MSLLDYRNRIGNTVESTLGGTFISSQLKESTSSDNKRPLIDLEKNLIKETKIKLEIATLEKYRKDKITPRGLRFHKTPSSEKDDPEFVSGWNLLLEGFAVTMMEYIIQKKKNKLPNINCLIDQLSKQVEQEHPREALVEIHQTLGEKLERIEKEVLIMKKRKYERDVEDYRRGNVHRNYEERKTEPQQNDSTVRTSTDNKWQERDQQWDNRGSNSNYSRGNWRTNNYRYGEFQSRNLDVYRPPDRRVYQDYPSRRQPYNNYRENERRRWDRPYGYGYGRQQNPHRDPINNWPQNPVPRIPIQRREREELGNSIPLSNRFSALSDNPEEEVFWEDPLHKNSKSGEHRDLDTRLERGGGTKKTMGKTRRGKRAGKQLRKREKRKEIAPSKGIFNLSDRILTRTETSVLNKGLKFAPTKNIDKFGVYIDLQRFKRKLSLKKYFLKTPVESSISHNPTPITHTKLRNKSKFFPRHMISDEMKTFETLVMRDVDKLSTKIDHYNLTKEENLALKNLQKDPTIVIKPADKGGGTVILSKAMYQEEVNRILNDDSTYGKLKIDPIKEIRQQLELLLQEGYDKGILNKSEFEYLSVKFTKTPYFYILPKIHKNPTRPPGRPIVAGIESITSHLSEYVDIVLQPIVRTIPSYLKDTLNMLQVINNNEWQKG
uniref:Uncharacterized protein n=1 Tax=Leptobrachium leishanense TaxID=445787 RepID=A0A8C5MAL6_9ANUR